ncbi:MAG: thiol-activated cytolysin family protein [Phycisphaerales bacterium]|nr:thiol-activated cytolysin family protein [Phycisphaerales bacterium]
MHQRVNLFRVSSATIVASAGLLFMLLGGCPSEVVQNGTTENANRDTANNAPPQSVAPISRGDASQNENENADTKTESAISDAERYFELVERARANRAADNPIGEQVLAEGSLFEELNRAGDQITEFTERTIRKTVDLSNLVMMDNTIGKAFPGSFLWAAPLRDGRLEPLRAIPGRPPVHTSFTALRDDAAGAVPVIFEHDGSFSGFMSEALSLFGARAIGGTRLKVDFKVSTSIDDALLSIGMSAKMWGFRMQAGLEHFVSERRSVAIMAVDQVFYSAAVDAPPIGGFLPRQLVIDTPELATELVVGAERGGEVAYVRKVDYGRRILIALSAEAHVDEMNRALEVAVNFIRGGFRGEIDQATRSLWESVEGKMIIIGGSYPNGISGFFGGDLDAFIETIRAITSADYINDTSGGVPVSFELAYAADDAPMQVFETTEFAGKIPGRRWGRVVITEPVTTNSDHARLYLGDNEMHSDDWTLVELTNQHLSLSDDSRTLIFSVVWRALEGDADRVVRNRTRFESLRTFYFPMAGAVRTIESPTSIAERQEWYAGERHNFNAFPDHGLLTNISFRFDGPGGRDDLLQAMQATLNVTVWLEQ